MNFIKTLFSLVCFFILSACGGGSESSSSYTINRLTEGTSYSCPTESIFNLCSAGNCSQCICTKGCDSQGSTIKAKLSVDMSPKSLAVGEPGQVKLKISSSAGSNQTVKFTLNYPEGETQANAFAFSSPCGTLALSIGRSNTSATVTVPANTASCTLNLEKRFLEKANPVGFVLSDLENIELEGSLPSVTVGQ